MRTRDLTFVLMAALQTGSVSVSGADRGTADSQPGAPGLYKALRLPKSELAKVELPNFHQVHSYLYRGGAPTEQGLKRLKAIGVTTIIDLRAVSERRIDEPKMAGELKIKYLNLPMSREAPTQAQIITFLNIVERAAAHPNTGSVFVHCTHGSDRTGCLIGVWRVHRDGWSYEQAYREMRHYYFSPKFTKLSQAVKRLDKPQARTNPQRNPES